MAELWRMAEFLKAALESLHELDASDLAQRQEKIVEVRAF